MNDKTPKKARTRDAAATRERLLHAAEDLFADRGYNAVSMREIAAHARVNLAAAGYHFGSKENLFVESLTRQMRPLNAARLADLDALETRATPPTLAEVLETFSRIMVETAVSDQETGRRLHRNLSRAFAESDDIARAIFRHEMLPAAMRFLQAIMRACPALSLPAATHGLAMFAGCLVHTLRWAVSPPFPELVADTHPDPEKLLASLIAFGESGFRRLAESGAPPGKAKSP